MKVMREAVAEARRRRSAVVRINLLSSNKKEILGLVETSYRSHIAIFKIDILYNRLL